ncbi:hypothetical protein B0J14DRAFT_69760 [Halenospora varia]|nr:hypothetical protein B0J14DRAFT_69760 [Halenospora varia]
MITYLPPAVMLVETHNTIPQSSTSSSPGALGLQYGYLLKSHTLLLCNVQYNKSPSSTMADQPSPSQHSPYPMAIPSPSVRPRLRPNAAPHSSQTIDSSRVTQIITVVKLGYTHLDTASANNTERELDAAIASCGIPRGKLFVKTKTLGFQPIEKAIEEGLEKKGLESVGLYLLRIPWFNSYQNIETAWKGMEAARASGKATSKKYGLVRRRYV